MKKVSIVPIYNKEQTLKKCINSLIKQTYQNIEIIFINDGSTDRSAMICKQYVNDKRVIYIYQENQGVEIARLLYRRIRDFC